MKNENRRLSEIMATIGSRIVRGFTNSAWVAGGRGPLHRGTVLDPADRARGANPGMCYSAVVLDGAFVYQGNGEPLWDINSLEPASIAGIEVYSGPATIPVKYNGTRPACGLVVIWTKP